jgi:hypothetical protein
VIGPHAETIAEPVIGYRNWALRDHRLHSAFLPDVPWHEATMHATCSRKHTFRLLPHMTRSPASDCRCGLYAFHTPPQPVNVPREIARAEPVPTFFISRTSTIAGAVVAWGKIQVHEIGFRAQHMRVVALQEPSVWSKHEDPTAWEMLRFAARFYRVPILDTDSLVRYAEEFGRVVPEGERP